MGCSLSETGCQASRRGSWRGQGRWGDWTEALSPPVESQHPPPGPATRLPAALSKALTLLHTGASLLPNMQMTFDPVLSVNTKRGHVLPVGASPGPHGLAHGAFPLLPP